MLEHWKLNGPPVYIAVAGYLGLIKPEAGVEKENRPPEVGNLNDLLSLAGKNGMIQ